VTERGTPAIEFDHVTKAFDSLRVLDEVSFRIEAGRSACILGRSGTGKSVALKHIVGLMRPESGRVLVEGRDMGRLGPRELSLARQRIGFLFQNAALFDSISVGENVEFPLRRHTQLGDEEIRSRAQQLLAQVGLEHDHGKMPADLSGGMKKRAGLARALALEPAILLADEPSAGLDPITAAEIDALLVGLRDRSGTTLLVVTHNIPSARAIGDELIFLDSGRILAAGAPEALSASDIPLVRQFMMSQGGG
jgi:phospholipid/cholesterol/gamma-HCH transport system ATP-binding protein